MQLVERRILEFSSEQLAAGITACFEGYIQRFVLDAKGFENRFRGEGLDGLASIYLTDEESPVGICLIARRGWTSRVAAMAIAPNYRRKGIGKRLMGKVISEARARGDRRMVLEVIEQNPSAIQLYEDVGMSKTRRLVGYRRPAVGVSLLAPITDLVEVDPLEVVRRMSAECDDNLPWDFKPENLSAKGPPVMGLKLGGSYALVVDTEGERAIIWSFFTARSSRRKGEGSRLIRAIAEKFSSKMVVTPVALPDSLAPEFFRANGFELADISQYEMAINL